MPSEEEGAPLVSKGLPSVGEGCHLSHIQYKCQIKGERKEGAPPLKSVGCHLKGAPPLQEGRTSQYTCAQKNFPSIINQLSINLGFVPFDYCLTFVPLFRLQTCPHMFLYFCLC
jgi:hypothetical protein